MYVQKWGASRVIQLHFIHIHFNMDCDHVPGTIWSFHITVKHVPITNGMLHNISAWKQRWCTV
jgi:hypothetical protein